MTKLYFAIFLKLYYCRFLKRFKNKISASCPQFASREGRSIDCTDGRLGGSECTFSCDPNGWKLSGNSTLYCKVHRVQVENSELPLPNRMNRDAFNMQVSATKQVALWNLNEPVCKSKLSKNVIRPDLNQTHTKPVN